MRHARQVDPGQARYVTVERRGRRATPRGSPMRIVLPVAIACGVCIASIDSRPGWDDTGITAGLLVLTSAAFGVVAPRGPWRWALAIGAWIPLAAIARHGDLKMLIVLAFPLAGAYAGSALRRATSRPVQPH